MKLFTQIMPVTNIYEREEKRHAGGLPLKLLELSVVVQRHTIDVIEYPGGNGFGARNDNAIMQSLLQSIVARHPDALDIWGQATAQMNPIPV